MTNITNGAGRHYILIEVQTRKAVACLADKVAGRAWTLEGVVGTHAVPISSRDAFQMAMQEREKANG